VLSLLPLFSLAPTAILAPDHHEAAVEAEAGEGEQGPLALLSLTPTPLGVVGREGMLSTAGMETGVAADEDEYNDDDDDVDVDVCEVFSV